MFVLSLADNFQSLARTRTDVASASLIWEAEEQAPAGPPVPAGWRRIDVRGLATGIRKPRTMRRRGAAPVPPGRRPAWSMRACS